MPFWLFASSVNYDLGGQCAMDRFSVIENDLNLLLKNLWRESGMEGNLVLVENRIYRSHF